jgi:hypothetical protein
VALESRREGKGKAASAIQWTKNNFEHGWPLQTHRSGGGEDREAIAHAER